MKIFSWNQNKRNAKQGSRTQNSVAVNQLFLKETSREEFSDWHNGLLTIGTFGDTNAAKEPDRRNPHQSEAPCQEHVRDITTEEVEALQKELNLINDKEREGNSLVQLNNDLKSYNTSSDISEKGHQLSSCAGKDSHLDRVSNVIGKKSMSFLLKRRFQCSSGLSPARSLRYPFPQSTHEKSRLQKILRTILSKKIYPQSSSPKATTAKRYLENKQICMADSKEEMSDNVNDGSKWVKTDDEFIVLEI